MRSPETRKIGVCGGIAVGKSALVASLLQRAFEDEYKATLGARIALWPKPTDTCWIWDLEGETSSEPERNPYLWGSSLILCVHDVTDDNWADRLKSLSAAVAPLGAPVIRVATKRDAIGSDLEQSADTGAADYFVSGKTGEGVGPLRLAIDDRLDDG